MFSLIKFVFLIAILVVAGGYYWLMPKIKYIQDNPGFCVNITTQLYYCGSEANLKGTLEAASKKLTPKFPDSLQKLLPQ